MIDTAIENCFTSRQSIARLYELVKVTSYWTTWSVQSTSLHSGTAGQSAGGKIIPCLAFPQLLWHVQVKCSDGAVMSQLWFLQPESQFLILIFPPLLLWCSKPGREACGRSWKMRREVGDPTHEFSVDDSRRQRIDTG